MNKFSFPLLPELPKKLRDYNKSAVKIFIPASYKAEGYYGFVPAENVWQFDQPYKIYIILILLQLKMHIKRFWISANDKDRDSI